jgi:putative flavoprotein involved in K+ transport
VNVIVIGAGQAGLVTGYFLRRAGLPFTIVDGASEIGHTWCARWDSLRLFTPARYSGLPGLRFPGDDPARYPAKDEVAGYLRDYARTFELPVQLDTAVEAVAPDADGYRVETSAGPLTATAVVVATGAFQRPRIPAFAKGLAPQVRQVHSARYRNPSQLAPGPVLVVGAGNSGLQLAAELAGAGHPVHLAVGSKQMALPRRILGADVFTWLDRSGFMRAPLARMPGWLAGDGDVLVGQSIRGVVRRHGVVVHPRAVAAAGTTITFEDGHGLDPANVVWATGFEPDLAWLPPSALDAAGRPVHTEGVSPSPNLYFVGLERLRTSGSALLGWVGRDAERIVARVAALRTPG